MSTRVFSTPDRASPMIFWRAVAFGLLRERLQVWDQLAVDEAEESAERARPPDCLRLAPPGAAQSRQR